MDRVGRRDCRAAAGGSSARGGATPRPGGPGAPGARGPRGPLGPVPVALEDCTGFTPIFDGTLKGWEGDTAYWRVENGMLIGESTAANPLKANTFLIWRGGEPADFELKLEFRINATNTGVQYPQHGSARHRSLRPQGLPGRHRFRQHVDGAALRRARPRLPRPPRPDAVLPDGAEKPTLTGQLKSADEIKVAIQINGWNTLHIIARGNTVLTAQWARRVRSVRR